MIIDAQTDARDAGNLGAASAGGKVKEWIGCLVDDLPMFGIGGEGENRCVGTREMV